MNCPTKGESGATVAEIDLETTYTAIPSWLPLTESVMPGHATEWLSIVDGVIVAYRSTLQETLTLELTGHGLDTHASRDTSLVIARPVFEPNQRTYQRLKGLGLLLVVDGELEIVPDPALNLTILRSSAIETDAPVERLNAGDSVTSPAGLVVRNSGMETVTALYVSMRPDGTRANMNKEPTMHEGLGLDQTTIGNIGILSPHSDVQVTLLDRATIAATSGRGHLRVALVLTREQPLDVESGAVAQIQGPQAAAGGCPEERSLYLAAAYQPVA